MENYQDIEDELIYNLNFKNPSTASYIIDRKSASFHSVGGNVYAPGSGSKLLKFAVNGEDWLDPDSFRIQFDLVNLQNVPLIPVSGPHMFFKRLRVLCRGSVVEDITEYNRCHELFNILRSPAAVESAGCENFGKNEHVQLSTFLPVGLGQVAGNGKTTVLFKLFSGLLNQPKYLCIKYMPLIIELELVDDLNDPICSEYADQIIETATPAAALIEGVLDVAFDVYNTNNNSRAWRIENPLIRCDMVTLDSELQNRFDAHLMSKMTKDGMDSSGKLEYKYSTIHSSVQQCIAESQSFNVSRSLSFLKRVFVSFIKYHLPVVYTGTATDNEKWFNPRLYYVNKNNDFYSTSKRENIYKNTRKVGIRTVENPQINSLIDPVQSMQLQIGSKLYPEYPLTSSQQAYYYLAKSLNINKRFYSHIHALDITQSEYFSHKFIMCFDVEKISGGVASFSGKSIKNGDLVTLNMKTSTDLTNPILSDTRRPDSVHFILEAEQVLEVRGTYVLPRD